MCVLCDDLETRRSFLFLILFLPVFAVCCVWRVCVTLRPSCGSVLCDNLPRLVFLFFLLAVLRENYKSSENLALIFFFSGGHLTFFT